MLFESYRKDISKAFLLHVASCVALLHNCRQQQKRNDYVFVFPEEELWIAPNRETLLYKSHMPYGAQLPVRLEPEVEKRLEAVARRLGTTKSALIRLLAKTFVDQVVKEDGGVELPPRWLELLPQRDTRSTRYPERSESVILNDKVNTKPTIEGVDPVVAEGGRALAAVAQRKARELGERDRAREKAQAERQESQPSRRAASTSGSTSGPSGGTGQRNK